MVDATDQKIVEVYDPEIEEMMKAGVHVGHAKSKRNPAMAPYVFAERQSFEIIDLVKTKEKLAEALEKVRATVAGGGMVLLVGTRPAAKKVIEEAARETKMPYCTLRWLGGTLTNFKVISKRIETMERLEREKASGELEKFTKKERAKIDEELRNLQKNFDGLRQLKKLPDLTFVADLADDVLPVAEAHRMHIPVVALSDTNANPKDAEFPIPSNDDALPAVRYMVGRVKDAILSGRQETNKKEA
ncbi:MAG: 30S ribosomal protein S2 [Candidatus Sungbacteria bacterium RIFCSPLOWO2_02_FULL_51_17]|uniref:Small ribosomal subunit protein uS2 n=1 Tax=Candidatus Sungbacteria bacterium RIFCSPHIGHO2_02_FULL_51_29 TaxID=1802273 RepID=A0A1G2KSP3_9BACT|nr:MAG: 30S ribosomal protein S2 [Candidatus Sungbacteria bacterium RIFCSPHIGHO2_01_FULL_51_22]OHA01379.1 MAG: 30S ribosomal protein S2 [Candidatus Sungbacteria bacterium RIFCSPHIGHO2_02_FULL_51_29]OHA07934.1 MAG: 30S ribosomal protein S2 [Candidatus Sungbacteria bacterium RIFCSPLOWO2_01_FULL_51_34]OHA12263.1 MAG: 30S ribosomal protein S2 [Candidatus Sungbacteria bacterium RIFCSPLOWO2_02_FULL_51_17]